MAESEEGLQNLVNEFGLACVSRKLRVNVGKSKVKRCARNGEKAGMNMRLNGEQLEEVERFKYLGLHVGVAGRMEVEVSHRVQEASKCMGGMKSTLL